MSVAQGAGNIYSQDFHNHIDANLLQGEASAWNSVLNSLYEVMSLERSFEDGKATFTSLVKSWMIQVVEKIIRDKRNSISANLYIKFFTSVRDLIEDFDQMALQGSERRDEEARLIKYFLHGKIVPHDLEKTLEYRPDMELLKNSGVPTKEIGTDFISTDISEFAKRYGIYRFRDKYEYFGAAIALPDVGQSEQNRELFSRVYRAEHDAIMSVYSHYMSKISFQKDELVISLYIGSPCKMSEIREVLDAISLLFSVFDISEPRLLSCESGSFWASFCGKFKSLYQREDVKKAASEVARDLYDATKAPAAIARKADAEANAKNAEANVKIVEQRLLQQQHNFESEKIIQDAKRVKEVAEADLAVAEAMKAAAEAEMKRLEVVEKCMELQGKATGKLAEILRDRSIAVLGFNADGEHFGYIKGPHFISLEFNGEEKQIDQLPGRSIGESAVKPAQ